MVNSDLFYVYGVHRGASWLGPFVTMIYQMCRKDCVQFLVIYGVFMAGFVQGFAALSTVVGSARMVRIAYNMQRSGVRPSVCLSHHSAAACGGFAAERRVARRYRPTVAGAQQQRRRSTALSGNAGSTMLTAELTRLNTDVKRHKVVTSEALRPGSVLARRERRESLRKEECR